MDRLINIRISCWHLRWGERCVLLSRVGWESKNRIGKDGGLNGQINGLNDGWFDLDRWFAGGFFNTKWMDVWMHGWID